MVGWLVGWFKLELLNSIRLVDSIKQASKNNKQAIKQPSTNLPNGVMGGYFVLDVCGRVGWFL